MTEKREVEITLRTIKKEIGYMERISAGEGVRRVPLPPGLLDAMRQARDHFEKVKARLT